MPPSSPGSNAELDWAKVAHLHLILTALEETPREPMQQVVFRPT
jgi:hypothetical protein